MRKLLSALALAALSMPALGAVDLGELVGYTLIAEVTVVGYVEDGKYEDGYEGCDFGRTLVFEDDRIVHCNDFNYDYAYRPKGYVFTYGSLAKIVIDDEVMNIRLR